MPCRLVAILLLLAAVTEARASDPILDVLRAHGGAAKAADGPLHPETRRFIEAAQIEGEIRDAATNQLLAAGVDRRRRQGAMPVDTWAEVARAMDFWADRVCSRLEARAGKRQAPLRRAARRSARRRLIARSPSDWTARAARGAPAR